MKSHRIERVAAVSNTLGEGIVWHASSNSIYWLDVAGGCRIFALCLSSGTVRSNACDRNLYCLRVVDDEMLVATTKFGLAWVYISDLTVHGEHRFLTDQTCLRFNDANCDSRGRLWTGTMVDNFQSVNGVPQQTQSVGEILSIEESEITVADTGYGCPNTFAWSPSDDTMYCADSVSGWIHSYDFNAESGRIDRIRDFHKDDSRGIPDGSAIDSEGCLWNARWDGAAIFRITPDGRVDEMINIPVSRVTDCTFGGSDLRTLYVTTARYGATGEDLIAQPLAGDVFAVSPGVTGTHKGTYHGRWNGGA